MEIQGAERQHVGYIQLNPRERTFREVIGENRTAVTKGTEECEHLEPGGSAHPVRLLASNPPRLPGL